MLLVILNPTLTAHVVPSTEVPVARPLATRLPELHSTPVESITQHDTVVALYAFRKRVSVTVG